MKRIESDRSDLRFLLSQKDARLQELEHENYSLRFKLDNMFNKFSRGVEQPSMPKIEKSGKYSLKQVGELGVALTQTD